jgi:hypothetical protein
MILMPDPRSGRPCAVGMAADKCSLWAAQAATKGGSQSWPEDGVARIRDCLCALQLLMSECGPL